MARAKQFDSLWAGLRDNSGNPLAAGTVTFYEAGTTTLKSVWQDHLKDSSQSNPATLDGYGRALIYGDGLYKLLIKNSAGTTLQTLDNVLCFPEDGRMLNCGTSGGSANNYTLTPTPGAGSYDHGDIYVFKANHTCTGASNLNVTNLGNKPARKGDGSTAMVANDLVQDYTYYARYDSGVGTGVFIVLNPSTASGLGIIECGTSTGSANAQILTPSPAIGAYVTGQIFSFKAGYTNTLTATIAVSGLGTLTLKKGPMLADLTEGDVVVDGQYLVKYDGTYGRLINPTCPHTLFRDRTSASVVSTASETTLKTYTLPAKTLAAGRTVRLTMQGDILQDTGGSINLTLKVKLGSTTLTNSGAFAITTNATRRTFKLVHECVYIGASSQYGSTIANTPFGVTQDMGTASEVDTNALALAVTGQWSSSSASADLRCKHVHIEVL